MSPGGWLGHLRELAASGHLPQRIADRAGERRTSQEQTMSTNEISPDHVLAVLARHVGAEQGVGIRALTREITGEPGVEHLERQVRHAVVELRRAGHHVCAHPASGYYLAATDEELTRTCAYLYDRAMCSLEQIAAMRRVSLPDLRGQLRLPT